MSKTTTLRNNAIELSNLYLIINRMNLSDNVKEVLHASIGHCEELNKFESSVYDGNEESLIGLRELTHKKYAPVEVMIELLYKETVEVIENLQMTAK